MKVDNPALITTQMVNQATYFASMPDDEMYKLAQYRTFQDKKTNSRTNMSRNFIKAVPFVDSMIVASNKTKLAGGLAVGSFSSVLGSFASRLAYWGALFAGIGIINKVTKSSPTLSDFDEEHPFAKCALDVGVLFALNSAIRKIGKFIYKAVPKNVKNNVKSFAKNIKEQLDNTNGAKKLYKPLIERFQNLAIKHPNLATSIKTIKPFVIPAMFILGFAKVAVIDPMIMNKKVMNNYNDLKIKQSEVRTYLGSL